MPSKDYDTNADLPPNTCPLIDRLLEKNREWFIAGWQAAKSVPVVGEPVAKIRKNTTGQVHIVAPDGNAFDMSKHIGSTLYTEPTMARAITESEISRLRKDAALGQRIRAEYNGMKTSTSERFLEALGVELDEDAAWAGIELDALLGIDTPITQPEDTYNVK